MFNLILKLIISINIMVLYINKMYQEDSIYYSLILIYLHVKYNFLDNISVKHYINILYNYIILIVINKKFN